LTNINEVVGQVAAHSLEMHSASKGPLPMSHLQMKPARLAYLAVALTIGFSFSTSQPAFSEQPVLTQSQKTLLEQQLHERYNCEFSDILFMRELEVGGRKQLEGRVRCTDQREVAFAQDEAHQKFKLQLCQPTVC